MFGYATILAAQFAAEDNFPHLPWRLVKRNGRWYIQIKVTN